MPLVQTRGAASAQGFGEFAQAATAVTYIEDVFSTYLYTGTGASLTITNGIDLSTKGGLVWMKSRSDNTAHGLYDTARGATYDLVSSTTAAQTTQSTGLTAFNTTGFTIGALAKLNTSASTYVSWSLRKQPKFFDVVTYTGTGSNRTISHSLDSVPACIFVKRTDTTGDWQVYHRSLANTEYLVLNTTAAKATGATRWNSTTPTSTVFSLGTDATVNASGGTYVAYIFAHDAGGFGLTGTDNVISCGGYSVDAVQSQVTVNLGYEPQWLLIKRATGGTGAWYLFDNMRGITTGGDDNQLQANSSGSEAALGPTDAISLTSTGFQTGTNATVIQPSSDYIYIAIRRGPMKVPTSGTSVFSPNTFSAAGTFITTNFVVDAALSNVRAGNGNNTLVVDRLRGAISSLVTSSTAAETTAVSVDSFTYNNGYLDDALSGSQISYAFRRAPSFFDVVCYTGTGTATTVSHNLGVVPELIIVKSRSSAQSWPVYNTTVGNTNRVFLNGNSGAGSTTDWNNTTPTASVFSLGTGATVNSSAATYVAYLFATCAGVSKVGTYTGTGTTLQVDCGFTAGARFVIIRRTSATSSDWYVWDTARGIVSGNDPYLLLNSTAAEVTSTDYIDPYSAGFEISSTAPAAINGSGGTFIFFAVA